MATVTTRPSLIVPGVQARIVFTPTTGNFLRVWVTDAPAGSSLRSELDKATTSRIRITELKESEGTFTWVFLPDKGGRYRLAIQEYNRGTNFGGGFADDPDALQKETAVGSEDTTQVVTVAKRLTQRIGARGDTATLVVYVAGTEIKKTTQQTHGETTPAIIEPISSRATTAKTATAVKAALAALEDTVATTVLGTLSSVVTEVINDFNAHRTQAGVHYVNDTAHVISTAFRSPETPLALEASMREVTEKLRLHFENQDADKSGVGSAGYHEDGTGNSQADMSNSMIAEAGGDTAGMIATIADAHRAYEAHRVDLGLHNGSDISNVLAPLPALLALHSAFIAELQKLEPDTPLVDHSAATTLIHGAGFEENEL